METDYEITAESPTKRRKIRKGTKSCWECKTRKMKCVYPEANACTADPNPVCIPCQRRRSKCVSQEFDFVEESENTRGHRETKGRRHHGSREDGDRVARIEALLEQLARKVDCYERAQVGGLAASDALTPSHGIPPPASTNQGSSRSLSFNKPSDINGPAEADRKYETLSQKLHDSLPSRRVLETIYNSHGNAILFHEMLCTPYAVLEEQGLKSLECLLKLPKPTSHPVLIARHMLYIAISLQHLHHDSPGAIGDLCESVPALMNRLAETAINLVTTKDELFGSIEGLEGVMLESMYHHNGGNLRRSWIANRRAIVVAQMMNLHKSDSQARYRILDHNTKVHREYMWFRIVSLDRSLCLLLGLTQSSIDQNMSTGAAFIADTLMGRLERIHCTLASRILQRNESDPCANDFVLTQTLDLELQKAGRTMPAKWWLMPNLDKIANDDQRVLFSHMGRLFNQLYHFNLLNQLHLPYLLLRSSASDEWSRSDYSRMTCVNASREILSRFLMFRSYDRNIFSCRTVDFFALMAAITLLLAHFDSHTRSLLPSGNLLAHQYLSDRAMIEQAQVNMQQISGENGDTLSAQSADLLNRLLAMDLEKGQHGSGEESVTVQIPESEMSHNDEDGAVRIQIPYFGIVRIAPGQGLVSKEMVNEGQFSLNNAHQSYAPTIALHTTEALQYEVPDHISARCDGNPSIPRSTPGGDNNSVDASGSGPHSQLALQEKNLVSDTIFQHSHDPGLSAGVDDWAFQGVDMAFFDSILRGLDNGDVTEIRDNSPQV
ncbi:hypothetical protein BJY01DRAFT_252860 [Aspergillus pseudoustus]|uniref:Zn(2)-C6 fungal-type domain-containing protein n=1 Tax=Aspergillus pseudoustus TaxID=1810923 RepID=A0ABR4J449_9EURO